MLVREVGNIAAENPFSVMRGELKMESNAAYTEPSTVTAEQGEVLVDGPDGVAVALTPSAAEETGRRLTRAAQEARGQAEAQQPRRRAG